MIEIRQQDVKRREDLRLATGKGQYTGDLRPEGMAFMVFVRSPHAHADIMSMEVGAAREAPGVLAVITGEDLRAAGLVDAPGGIAFKRPDGSEGPKDGRPSLVTTRVRHMGEAVVAVVAETRMQAEDAAELVEIEYETLPAVTSAAAVEPGAPAVWEHVPDNIAYHWSGGDAGAVETALASAAHVTRLPMRISRLAVNSMETRNALVVPQDGRLLVHASHQSPFLLKGALEQAGFKEPITVQVGDVGGSFGLKSGYLLEAVPVAHAARLLNRPVIWESTRSEAFLTDDHAREMTSVTEIGFDADHRIVGMRVRIAYQVGAYVASKSGGLVNNMGGFAGPYDIPAIHGHLDAYFSNTNFLAAYRGAGRPEATLFVERALDVAARELGVSRFELRRRNLIPEDKMPYRTALTFEYDCGAFEKVMDKAMALADVDGYEDRRRDSAARGKLRGLGLSNSIELAGGPYGVFAPDIARVALLADGRLRVQPGSMSVGQSFETVFPQIVADRFGVPGESVVYDQGNTDILPYGRGNGGSSATCVGGPAVAEATEALVSELVARAAAVLEVGPEAVTLSEGIFRAEGNRSLTLAELAEATERESDEVAATGEGKFKPAAGTFPNGMHICEVEIDPETGVVEVARYSAVEDIGTVVNPMTADGQIHGGVVQGIGQVLGEEIVYDEDGQLLTGSFMDYQMPRAADVPFFNLAFHPVPTKVNPLGAKGVGEAGTVGALSATMSAVADALAGAGVMQFDMPATPHRVWRAIREAQQAG
ncbi:xanthine dehydrogenase family protein molybdopterin-binding subunit [Salipiger sp.]|uniref:xanthine dehydrogenase family protein molybdopterin-binding subunit n=1 Tax=Salipiger sp. TaxID=2078585 RepID=UPI003A97A0BA